jgi:hypothetical protein
MSELVNSVLNAWLGQQPEPIDWEAKSRADEQRIKRILEEAAKKK